MACGNAAHKGSLFRSVFDPAYVNTAVARSAITFIDGDEGILQYRGYNIEDLAEHSNFLEVCYLLIYGELPDKVQAQAWETEVMRHTFVHEKLADLMCTFNYDSHPMGMFISGVAAMSTFHPEANPALQVLFQHVLFINTGKRHLYQERKVAQ